MQTALFVSILILNYGLGPMTLPDAKAIGIAPAVVNLGSIAPGDSQTGSVLFLRDNVHDTNGNLNVTVSVRNLGANGMFGNSSFILPKGTEELPYTFTITPTTSAQGDYAAQLDFVVNQNGTPSSSTGSAVQSGATVIIQFTVPNDHPTPPATNESTGGSSGGGSSSSSSTPPIVSTPIAPTPIATPPVASTPIATSPPVSLLSTEKQIIILSKPIQVIPKSTLPSSSAFSQTNASPTLILQEVGKADQRIIIDTRLPAPLVESPTHTTEYRYYKSNDVEIDFTPPSPGIVYDKFLYVLNQESSATINQMQTASTSANVNLNLPDGVYYLHAVGMHGNKVSEINTRKILIDATPPVIEKVTVQTQASIWKKSTHDLDVNLFDKTSGIAYYKLITPEGTEVHVLDQIPLTHLHLGDQIYELDAVDNVGNIKTETLNIHVERETEWETVKRLGNAMFGWMRYK